MQIFAVVVLALVAAVSATPIIPIGGNILTAIPAALGAAPAAALGVATAIPAAALTVATAIPAAALGVATAIPAAAIGAATGAIGTAAGIAGGFAQG